MTDIYDELYDDATWGLEIAYQKGLCRRQTFRENFGDDGDYIDYLLTCIGRLENIRTNLQEYIKKMEKVCDE